MNKIVQLNVFVWGGNNPLGGGGGEETEKTPLILIIISIFSNIYKSLQILKHWIKLQIIFETIF